MEYGAIVPFSLNGSLAHGNEEGKKKVYLNSYQQCQLVIGTFTNLNLPILTLHLLFLEAAQCMNADKCHSNH